ETSTRSVACTLPATRPPTRTVLAVMGPWTTPSVPMVTGAWTRISPTTSPSTSSSVAPESVPSTRVPGAMWVTRRRCPPADAEGAEEDETVSPVLPVDEPGELDWSLRRKMDMDPFPRRLDIVKPGPVRRDGRPAQHAPPPGKGGAVGAGNGTR